jgi:hypothetical protein
VQYVFIGCRSDLAIEVCNVHFSSFWLNDFRMCHS